MGDRQAPGLFKPVEGPEGTSTGDLSYRVMEWALDRYKRHIHKSQTKDPPDREGQGGSL